MLEGYVTENPEGEVYMVPYVCRNAANGMGLQ